jgi:hypothetical protein
MVYLALFVIFALVSLLVRKPALLTASWWLR